MEGLGRELTEKEKVTLCALVKHPKYNDRELADVTKLNLSTITAIRRNRMKQTRAFLLATVFLGGSFLVNKYFEWGHKFEHGIYPNSKRLVTGPPGENIFFGLYYVITGLHGLHIIFGLSLLLTSVYLLHRRKIRTDDYVFLENSGLYWHLVDLIWIFIFPLFYLVL